MWGKKGVVGELLIIVVLLASTLLIVTTFTDEGDTPNIPKYSVDALRDVKTLLSRAILQWMRDGVTDEPLACNGLYAVDSSAMIETLEPYVADELAASTQGDLRVSPGVLEGIEFDGISNLRITLADGSIIYDDGNIYAEDTYDKDYLFNVRLPLALKILQDWIKCDAGNLSKNLQQEFGDSCFFGKKNPGYGDAGGNVCLRTSYTLNEADRQYMLRYAPTPEDVSAAAELSIEELNKYFAGDSTCKNPALDDDTGITCSYTLEDLEFEYNMNPWSSEEIVRVRTHDYDAFTRNDDHVHRLNPAIHTFPYDDEQLGCVDEPREPVYVSVSPVPYQTQETFVDVKEGDIRNFYANPVMYVNTTRGAKFSLVVTCKDTRVALLGQPLEYTFELRHGIKQHCGPTDKIGARHRCGACSPMPAANLERCIKPGKPAPCDTYYRVCAESTVWSYLNEHPGLRDGRTYSQYVTAYEDLQQKIYAACETVPGMESKYPPPQPPSNPPPPGWDACPVAFPSVCCAAPGFDPENDCADPMNINNPQCFLSKANVVSLCYAPSTCGEKQCYETKCDASNDYSCDQTTPKPVGSPCNSAGGASCFSCQENGDEMECGFDDNREGQQCSVSYPTSCNQYVCDKAVGGCATKVIPSMVGQECTYQGYQPQHCSDLKCTPEGYCNSVPANEGDSCGSGTYETATHTCTYENHCQNGFCSQTGQTCTPKSDGGCRCTRDEYGNCPASCQ